MIDSFVLVAYSSLAASQTLLQRLVACLNFTLNSEDLFCWYKKKVFSMSYGSNRSCWKPSRLVMFDMILTMKDIYINSNLNPLTKFPTSSTSTEFKNNPPMEHLSNYHKTIPISTRIVISYAMGQASCFEFTGKSMENEATTWSEIPNGWKVIKEQTQASEERKKSKRAGLWQS